MRLIALLIVGVGLVGCGTKPKLLRHYQSASTSGAKQPYPEELALSVFTTSPKPSTSSTLVAGLTERGQAELIKSLASKLSENAKPAELVELLSEPYQAKPKACGWADHSSMTRRLALTLTGELPRPADRVDRLEIILTLQDKAAATFTSWDRFDSVYASFNIGTATFTQTDKLTAGRSSTGTRNLPNAGGADVSLISFGAETTDVLAESATYSLRRLSLGGALTERSARLIQEGGPNINLFGTSAATITIHLKTQEIPLPVYKLGLLSKDSKPMPSSEVSIERCQGKFPLSNSNVLAQVAGTASVREAVGGDGTVSEGDDKVVQRRISLAGLSSILISTEELDAQVFALAQCKPGQKPKECPRVDIQEWGGSDTQQSLFFATPTEAGALRAWLFEQAKSGRVKSMGGRPIGISTTALTGLSKEDISSLQVLRIWHNAPGGGD